MRYLLALATVTALLAAAPVQADATTGFRRTITTTCPGGETNGRIDTLNKHTGSRWLTPEPCRERIFDFQKQTYYYIYRPWTDFKAGDMAARHWYPDCYHELDDVIDFSDNSYDLIYAFICP